MSSSNKKPVKQSEPINSYTVNQFVIESNVFETDSISDQDILNSIQREYLNVDKFDVCGLELSKIPKSFNSNDIIIHCKNVIHQHYIVSKKVLLLVLQKQSKCNEIFDKIIEIQKFLINTIKLCKICRENLNLATRQFISSSLHILYQFRKQKILESILNVLYNIKELVSI
jgi:hypothetical protein